MQFNKLKPATLRAFTIMEVTVAMIIAAIAIMITYTIYGIVSKGYLDFLDKNRQIATLVEIDHLLQRDFNEAGLIVSVPGGLYVQKEKGNILYQFGGSEIIRKSTVIDTFKVLINKRSVSFQGLPVHQELVTYRQEIQANNHLSIELSRLDELNLFIRFQNEDLPYTYRKKYSSVNLIHRKGHAIN